jgi:hypothetical protein
MSGFEKYSKAKSGRHKGCPRCGAEKAAGAVSVALRKLGSTGQLNGGKHLASRSRSMCEPCCVAVYEALLAELEKQPEGERS